jgi:AbrB family looped-hinge helix DNA binding protein
MPIVKMLAKGQVVIPKQIREALRIVAGAKLYIGMEGKKVVLYPLPTDPIGALCGIPKGGPSLTKALLEDRKQEREREERKFARFLRRPGPSAKGKRAG